MELALVFLAGFAIGALIALFWTTSKLRSQFSSHIIEAGENLKAAEATPADLFHKQEELRSELEAKMQELILVREQLDVRARLDTEIRLRVAAETKLENPEINLKQQEKLLDEATARLADTFASLSAEALKSNNQVFLTLATSNLETIHTQAKNDVESVHNVILSLVASLRESLDNYTQQVVKMAKSREYMYGRLDEQLKIMGGASRQLQEEIGILVTALRAPHTREHLVDMTLRRTAELAGMSEHGDFDAHETLSRGNGRQRPSAGHVPNAIAAAWSDLLDWLQMPMRSSNVGAWSKVISWLRYGS
jgi:DNA recombination protein RmuC